MSLPTHTALHPLLEPGPFGRPRRPAKTGLVGYRHRDPPFGRPWEARTVDARGATARAAELASVRRPPPHVSPRARVNALRLPAPRPGRPPGCLWRGDAPRCVMAPHVLRQAFLADRAVLVEWSVVDSSLGMRSRPGKAAYRVLFLAASRACRPGVGRIADRCSRGLSPLQGVPPRRRGAAFRQPGPSRALGPPAPEGGRRSCSSGSRRHRGWLVSFGDCHPS